MPTSWFNILPSVVEVISQFRPTSILDVGCGFGKYGFLAREILDIAVGRYYKEDWETQIDAVEPVREFITPMHDYIYDRVFITTAQDFVKRKMNYDLVLMLEVIEHLEKKEGAELLKNLMRCSNLLLLSFPAIPILSDYPIGSEFARHKSQWFLSDFQNFVLLESKPIALLLFFRHE